MNGHNSFEKVDVEVGNSWKNEKSQRVLPLTEMKKLKIKKIDEWEHNESIIKKKLLNNEVETDKKNMPNWKKNESIMVYVFCF